VRIQLPLERQVARVELLKAAVDVPFERTGGALEFTIPQVADYEVAAIHAA